MSRAESGPTCIGERGWMLLGEAIVGQAVDDLRLLRGIGIIDGARVTSKWPVYTHGHNKDSPRLLHGYRNPREVQDLLRFLRGRDVETVLDACMSQVDAAAMRERLNITTSKGR